MSFLKAILKDKSLDESMKEVWKRFPVSVLMLFTGATLILFLIHFETSIDKHFDLILRIIISLVLSFFMSIGVYLGIENGLKIHKAGKHSIPLVFFGLFFSGITIVDALESVIFFMVSLTGIISLVFFAAYVHKFLSKKYKEEKFYSFFYKISVVFLMSFIVGGVLTGLGLIGIGAIYTLFDLRGILSEKIYADWMILALIIITPLFALTNLPNKKEVDAGKDQESKFFSFMIKFIIIPFVSCYFLILYAYSLKVLINFSEWPKGEVSWMVIVFSVFAYIAYIYSYAFIKKRHNS